MATGSSFRTEHHYVAGMVITAIGVLGVAGSLTGRLAAMLAGLFCPSALYTVNTSSSSSTSTSTSTSTSSTTSNTSTSNIFTGVSP